MPKLFAIGTLAAATSTLATPARADSFADVLELIAAKHPKILAAHYLVKAGQADVSAARANYRPQLGVTADLGWNNATTNSPSGASVLPEVKISQLVFDGGRTPAEIRRRKVRVEQLGVQEQATLADLSQQLAQAWIDYARSLELLEVGDQQVSALQVLDRLVTDIAKFDPGRTSDVVMVESRLEQARTALYARQISVTEARARIREVAALPVEPQGTLPGIAHLLPATAADCHALVEASPNVRLADLGVAESHEAENAARNWWLPQLSVEAARTSERTIYGDTHLLNGFAFRLRAAALPFDSGGGRARYTSAAASLQSSQANAQLTRTGLEDQTQRLWVFQSQRSGRLPDLIGLVGRADQARDIVFEQFRIGRRSILDVLAYDLERFSVRAQLVNERFDIMQTQYQLMGVLGRIYPAIVDGEAPSGSTATKPPTTRAMRHD